MKLQLIVFIIELDRLQSAVAYEGLELNQTIAFTS